MNSPGMVLAFPEYTHLSRDVRFASSSPVPAALRLQTEAWREGGREGEERGGEGGGDGLNVVIHHTADSWFYLRRWHLNKLTY